jgi:hypothetical protein
MAETLPQSLEKRRALLDPRHKYILDKFNTIIPDVKPIELENAFLQSNKLELVNDFLKEGGSRRVVMSWTLISKVSDLIQYTEAMSRAINPCGLAQYVARLVHNVKGCTNLNAV